MSSMSQLLAVKALDGLHLRAIAIAENVANAGSRAFRPKSVDFEGELRRAVAEGPAAVAAFEATTTTAAAPIAGGDVRLDLEMAGASATALRYAALTDVLNRQMQLDRLAVKGQ